MTPDLEPLMTIDDVARWLALEPQQVYELVRPRAARPLPGLKIGKYLRFRRHDVEQWLAGANRDGR